MMDYVEIKMPQGLNPGKCRGSWTCASGSNFLIGCVNRHGSSNAPDLKPKKVSRQTKIVVLERILDRMCEKNRVLSSAQDLKPGECRGSQKLSSRREFLRGCVVRSVLFKCPRSQARTVSRQSKIVFQERIPETTCEQNTGLPSAQDLEPGKCWGNQNNEFLTGCEQTGVVEVFQISSQESVQVVKLSLRSECLKGCVNRLWFFKCPRSQAKKVLRRSQFSFRCIFLRGCVNRIGVCQVPKISSQESVEGVKCVLQEQISWWAVWTDVGHWSAPNL